MPHIGQWLKNLQVLDVSVNPVTNALQGDLGGLESLHSLWIHDLTMWYILRRMSSLPSAI